MANSKGIDIDAYRFWVGSEDSRVSSVWKIWSKANQIYALTTAMRGTAKLSIHDEVCQFGFTKNFRAERSMGKTIGGFPSFLRWKRPKPAVGSAAFVAIIQFPTDYLFASHPAPKIRNGKFQRHIPVGDPGGCVELAFFSVTKLDDKGQIQVKGANFAKLLEMPLGEKEVCLVLLRKAKFDREFLEVGQEVKDFRLMPEASFSGM